ncbi:MAG: acetyl-CoA synthase subunit gamma [Desulfobulbus sp.]|nr:MAG: acetyl-CoA synthase subunit gamma [Desulfobulbus sp.]
MAKEVPEGAGEFQIPSSDQPFVQGAVSTPVGSVPQVATELTAEDKHGHYLVRWNIGRDHFTVEPGLYAVGSPDADSTVFVGANYKMSFDLLRQTLTGRNGWLLILDTKGINVWCAAGKGTFGTEEMLDRIKASRLDKIVTHHSLIVPQLGAPGLAAHEVRKYSGFKVIYGPILLKDLPEFLDNGLQATPAMRSKTFPLQERIVLIPVEIMQGLKQGIPLILFFLLIAGVAGRGSFFRDALVHGLPPGIAVLVGIFSGTVLTPLFLPWLPGRAFSCKGAVAGLALFIPLFAVGTVFFRGYNLLEQISWLLLTLAVSSWLGMAFTGASTFTSLNGVKKEMLRAMPLQFFSLVAGIISWGIALRMH